MLRDNVAVTGKLSIAINGEVVREVDNLVVTDGKEFVVSRMKDTTLDAMSHMAVGTNNTAADAADATLNTELARVALTSTNVSGVDIVYAATFPAGTGTGALVEAGIFNDATTGIMLCRTVFAVVNKGALDAMTITWTVTAS